MIFYILWYTFIKKLGGFKSRKFQMGILFAEKFKIKYWNKILCLKF